MSKIIYFAATQLSLIVSFETWCRSSTISIMVSSYDHHRHRDKIKSVYAKNLPPSEFVFEVEEEFKNFGRLSDKGMVIRSHNIHTLCILS
ncbi:hypothetical protein I3760_12G097000 [Carya illinoinensis]|nr:hypothetical protein I3760_12G097000 [Carya illinoinensis]